MRKGKQSYTILEVAVITSVIAVLISLAVPGITAVMNRVHRAQAAQYLRTIAMAHAQFISDFDRAITYLDLAKVKSPNTTSPSGPHDVNSFAAVLAKYGYLNDVSTWAWDFDYKIRAYKKSHSSLPKKIYDQSTNTIASDFKGSRSGGSFPISVTCSVIECANFPYKSLLKGKYVAAVSRGLNSSGKWNNQIDSCNGGVFGDTGGLVAYFDGHVEWVKDISNKFQKYNSTQFTTNLCETLPNYHGTLFSGDYENSCFVNFGGNGSEGNIH